MRGLGDREARRLHAKELGETVAGAVGNNLFTSSTQLGYKGSPCRAEDGGMVEFALGIGAAVFVHRWLRSAGLVLGIPAVTVTVLAVLL